MSIAKSRLKSRNMNRYSRNPRFSETPIPLSHYIKPMPNRYFGSKIALSTTLKMNILVTDLVRIVSHVAIRCSKSENQTHIQYTSPIKWMQ